MIVSEAKKDWDADPDCAEEAPTIPGRLGPDGRFNAKIS